MRKIIGVVLIITLVLTLAACASQTAGPSPAPAPEETVREFMTALVRADYTKLATLMDSSESFPDMVNAPEEEEGQELVEAILSKVTYRIGESRVDGADATVALSVAAPNLLPIVGLVFAEVMPAAFSLALSGAEDAEEQIDTLFMASFLKHINAEDAPTVESETEVNLVLKNDSWLIVPDDSFINAVTGNLQDAWEELTEGGD